MECQENVNEGKDVNTEPGKVDSPSWAFDFSWPYKLKEFEKELAVFEVENITHLPPIKDSDGVSVESDSKISQELLKRVSSFHKVTIRHGRSSETILTHQAMLEKTAQFLRQAKNIRALDRGFGSIQNICLKKREKQYLLHELHPYKGKYYPQLVRPLITGLMHSGQKVLDPFCGCGTTLIEAYFSGIGSVGVDLNPIAYFITTARIGCLEIDPNELSRQVDKLLRVCKAEKHALRNVNLMGYLTETNHQSKPLILPSVPNASTWFSKGVLEQLGVIRAQIQSVENEEDRDFFLLTLSSIVKRVSNWDPKQVRQGLLESPRQDVDVFDIFERQLRRYFLIVYAYHKTKQNVKARTDAVPKVYQHNSRHLEFLEDRSFDAIVTSPPYATALPYLDTDRLPMYVLEILKPEKMKTLKESMVGERDITPKVRDRVEGEFLSSYDKFDLQGKETIMKILLANKSGVGFRRRNLASNLFRYFTGMKDCIKEMDRLLRPGGYCCIVIGNNRTRIGNKEAFWINTQEILKEMVLARGMQLSKEIAMSPTSAYMVHADNMIRDEYILVFRKPI